MGKANSSTMLRLLLFLMTLSVHAVRAIFRTREELLIENLALRQQVAMLRKERPRPVLNDLDRAFWVALRASWPGWARQEFRAGDKEGPDGPGSEGNEENNGPEHDGSVCPQIRLNSSPMRRRPHYPLVDDNLLFLLPDLF